MLTNLATLIIIYTCKTVKVHAFESAYFAGTASTGIACPNRRHGPNAQALRRSAHRLERIPAPAGTLNEALHVLGQDVALLHQVLGGSPHPGQVVLF